ncbi:MAG: hypothetical protein IPK03_02610 [Bacteroidetes bacterium]|nr:hypothetical protein [Bacteroidota bacterium]
MEHQCDEIFKKIVLLLDNELNQEEKDWLRDELIACPACLENYEMEKDFKEMLCEKLKCMESCECNEEQLKSKILSKIRNREK